VKTFEGIGRTWETKAFEVREVIEQGETVAMFGSFTYRGRKSGKEITSPFSLLAHVKEGKVSYIQVPRGHLWHLRNGVAYGLMGASSRR
jgi:hypothetical protein